MQINWSEFTPFASLAGGLLIGLSATLLLLLNGQIAGVSGIIRQSLLKTGGERIWRLCFLLGLLLSPTLYYQLYSPIPIQMKSHIGLLIAAGLFVGVGTAMASGCTSGHGVCGLSRLSKRSLFAAIIFMTSAMLTTFMAKHL